MALGLSEGIGLGAAALGGLFGLFQKGQANRLERENKLPIAKVNANIANNAAQAQNMAKIGLASQQYNNSLSQQQQNLSTVLASASKTGQPLNTAALLRQANQGTQNLNAQDAVARQQNQRLAMQQNGLLAQEQQRVWNWNFAQPYLRTAQQVASLRNAGNQNIFGAVGSVAQIGMGAASDESSSGGQTIQPNFFQSRMQAYGTPNYGFGGVTS